MTFSTTYRPSVQQLENRRCMAASLGFDSVPTSPTELESPANATVVGTAISGNTANQEGGGIFRSLPSDSSFTGGVRVSVGDVNEDANGSATPLTNSDSIWMDLGYPVPSGDTQVGGERPDGDTTSDADKHSYSPGGIFTITVTVIDDDMGQASADQADAFFAELGENATRDSGYPHTYSTNTKQIIFE